MVELCAALDEGVKLERESRSFYAAHAAKTPNTAVRSLLEMLAREEAEHERVLEALKRGATCPINAAKALGAKAPKIGNVFSSEESGEYSTMLLTAMSFEQKTKEFYKAVAAAAQNSGEAKAFRELAAFEQKHYDLLNSLYDELNYYRLQT